MGNAVNTTPFKTESVVTKVLGKGVGFMQAFVRQYPGFAYLGFGPQNWYKAQRNINGMKGGTIHQLESFQDTSFTKVSQIESTLTEDGKKITWYEGDSFATSSEITADSATADVVVASVSGFAVNDIVRTMPAVGSAGTETQATISAINEGTKTITLSASVDVKDGDKLLFIAPELTIGNKVERTVASPDAKTVTTYFQKHGGSVTMKQEDLNKTRLLQDIKDYISNEFNKPKMQVLENIISTWFFGENVGGNTPKAQGIVTLIEEREARGQTSKYDLSGVTDDKAKLKQLQDILNLAATAPVYMGGEKPTVFCTTTFSANFSRLLQSELTYNDNISSTIEYNLKALSTPYFQNINFIVLPEMDRIYGQRSKAFVFPKELVSFRTPENEFVNESGVAVKVQANKFSVIAQPIVTNDYREYTTEYYLANIFAGQSYDNAYMVIDNLN